MLHALRPSTRGVRRSITRRRVVNPHNPCYVRNYALFLNAAVAASIGTAGGSKLRGEELGGERVFRVESINIDQTPVASSHYKA
jgi:hypothetical protein